MAGLKVKIGADTSVLAKGITRAKGLVSGLGRAVKSAGIAGLAVGAAGATAALAGLAVSIRGVSSALTLGGDLSDISAQTGIAVGELVVLRRAFEDNGVAGEKVGGVFNKMQKGIADLDAGLSTQVRAFDRLGLSYDDLADKSPSKQFELIQKGLAGVENITLRTGAAMDIFGRSGGQLQALFNDTSAISNAADSVGDQADILERNAAVFDRSADLLGGMGAKLQGFFVGFAEFINPLLLPVLEKINQIDLAAYGQAVGRFVALVAEAFKQDALPGLLEQGLVFAGKGMINFMWTEFQALTVFFGSAFAAGVDTAFSKVTDVSFWSGVAELFKSAGSYIESAAWSLRAAFTSGELQESFEQAAASGASLASRQADRAFEKMREAGNGEGIGEAISFGIKQAEEFRAGAPKLLDAAGELESMTATMVRLKESVDKNNEKEPDAERAKLKPGEGGGADLASVRVEAPRVQSLAKVGGALATRRVDLASERNGLLKSIVRNTGKSNVAVFA